MVGVGNLGDDLARHGAHAAPGGAERALFFVTEHGVRLARGPRVRDGRVSGCLWVGRAAGRGTVPAVVLALRLAAPNEPSSSLRNMVFVSLVVLAFATVGSLVAS